MKQRVATFSASSILESLSADKDDDEKNDEKSVKKYNGIIHLVLTKHILVEDKSITSTLYAGLCMSDKKLMIVSFARLKDDKIIATVINHEIGHMIGLSHCEDKNCIMRSGQHGIDVVASDYWCIKCSDYLNKHLN